MGGWVVYLGEKAVGGITHSEVGVVACMGWLRPVGRWVRREVNRRLGGRVGGWVGGWAGGLPVLSHISCLSLGCLPIERGKSFRRRRAISEWVGGWVGGLNEVLVEEEEEEVVGGRVTWGAGGSIDALGNLNAPECVALLWWVGGWVDECFERKVGGWVGGWVGERDRYVGSGLRGWDDGPSFQESGRIWSHGGGSLLLFWGLWRGQCLSLGRSYRGGIRGLRV